MAANARRKTHIVHTARDDLRRKLGPGPLDPGLLLRCQKAMDEVVVDFAAIALPLLGRIDALLSELRDKDTKHLLTHCVMELKGHGALFGKPLVTRMAALVLALLESVHLLDTDAQQIVQAHARTLRLIVRSDARLYSGPMGEALLLELQHACERYYIRKLTR